MEWDALAEATLALYQGTTLVGPYPAPLVRALAPVELLSRPSGRRPATEWIRTSPLLRNKSTGAPHLARFSRDVGYHSTPPTHSYPAERPTRELNGERSTAPAPTPNTSPNKNRGNGKLPCQ